MWKYLLIFCLACPALGEPLRAQDQDKQLHFLASYSINTTVIEMLPKHAKYKFFKASMLTAAVGVAKELSDPVFSSADLAADGIGILTSSVLAFTFDF